MTSSSEYTHDRGGEPSDGAQRPPPQSTNEAFHRLQLLLAEMKEYASYFMSAKADSVKLSVRRAVLYGVLGAIGVLIGATTIVMGAVLLWVGAAYGLVALFADIFWLGMLVAGAAILLLVVIGTWAAIAMINSSQRKHTVDKYEQRKKWQRGQFLRDVPTAAASQHD